MMPRLRKANNVNKEKRSALEAAGWRFGDAADFLELSDEERQLVELRLQVGRAMRMRRLAKKLSQHDVAVRMKSSQSRVAKIEMGAAGVSLDLMFRGLFAVGGKVSDITTKGKSPARRVVKRLS